MNKIAITILSAAVMMFAVAGTAYAEAGDLAAGSGRLAAGDSLSVTAHSGPFGEDPHGQFRYSVPDVGTLVVAIDCLAVTGNSAIIAGSVVEATGAFTDRTNAKAQIIDGGKFDQIALSTQVGTDCSVPPPQVFHTVTQGNFVVKDQ